MAIGNDEIKHYSKPLAEFLASANGYTDFLIKSSRYAEALVYNMSLYETLKNLSCEIKKQYRTAYFLFNATISAYHMNDMRAARDLLFLTKNEIKETGKGSLNIDFLKEYEALINQAKDTSSDIQSYIG